MDSYWNVTMTDEFFEMFDSKYKRVYHGNYDEWKAVDMIMTNAVICLPGAHFDSLSFEYRFYRYAASAMRIGTLDNHKDTFIVIMAAAFYVLEVKGNDRYIEPVLTVLNNLRDDTFFTYSKKDFNEYVFIAAQIAGPQATAYALAKLDIVQRSDGKEMEL